MPCRARKVRAEHKHVKRNRLIAVHCKVCNAFIREINLHPDEEPVVGFCPRHSIAYSRNEAAFVEYVPEPPAFIPTRHNDTYSE